MPSCGKCGTKRYGSAPSRQPQVLLGLKLLKQDGYVGVWIPPLGETNAKDKTGNFVTVGCLMAGHGHLLFSGGDDPTGPPIKGLPDSPGDGAQQLQGTPHFSAERIAAG